MTISYSMLQELDDKEANSVDRAEFEQSETAQKLRSFYRRNYEPGKVQGGTRRVTLPESWVKDLKLLDKKNDVVVLGLADHLQVISTAAWREARKRDLAEILERERRDLDGVE